MNIKKSEVLSKTVKLLNFEEGFRDRPYLDHLGYPTIGTGIKIGPKGSSLSNYEMVMPESVSDAWMSHIIDGIYDTLFPNAWFSEQSVSRQCILVSMAYQMGVSGLKKFRNMLLALDMKNYHEAQAEAIDSLWYKQTPHRAKRHAEVILTGDLEAVYAKHFE